ncbi:hypothetical protein NG796_23590 [Laspinema sp. A4]|nr:hypothetical protein [Laspinema sp. D2d]MCT7986261.1 hypothetical protein [Laspinema sp. D2d]
MLTDFLLGCLVTTTFKLFAVIDIPGRLKAIALSPATPSPMPIQLAFF